MGTGSVFLAAHTSASMRRFTIVHRIEAHLELFLREPRGASINKWGELALSA